MIVQTPDEAVTPTANDTELARTSSDALAVLLADGAERACSIRVHTEDLECVEIPLPGSAVRFLVTALQAIARGHSVTVLPVDAELTTQRAAELMRVSRPSLIKMLDEKKLPYRKVGAHRRVRYDDVLNYLNAERARRKKVMEELVAETESLGLYK